MSRITTETRAPRTGRLAVLITLLVAFTAYSSVIVWQHGYWGFLDAAYAGGWSTQVFLDLCIALTIASTIMLREARKSGINGWLYVLTLPFLGSIGAIACLIHAELRRSE